MEVINIIKNEHPIMLASPEFNERGEVVNVTFAKIVSWHVCRDNNTGGVYAQPFAPNVSTTAIDLDSGVSMHALWGMNDEGWRIQNYANGYGKNDLINCFQSLVNAERAQPRNGEAQTK